MRIFTSTLAVVILSGTAAVAHAQAAPPKAFVELGLGYGYGLSTSDFLEVSQGTKLDSPHASGPALDLAGGYAFAPNLAVFGDLQWAYASTIEGQNDNGETQQYTVDYTSLGVGLRTTAPIGPGAVYAQLALGAVFPFETERVQHMTNNESRTTTIGYNSGFGARGELGYHYQLNRRLYLLGGVRVQAFATDNVGRERVRVDQPSGNVDRETYSTDPNAPNTSRAQALSVQDLRLRIGVGLQF